MILGYNGILKEVGYYLRFNYNFEQVAPNIFVSLYNQLDFNAICSYVDSTPCLKAVKTELGDTVVLSLTTYMKGVEIDYNIILDSEGIEVVINE